MKQGSWSIKYYADGVRIRKSEFKSLISQKDPKLYQFYSEGKSNVILSDVLGFAGGFMLGYNIGNLITGKSDKLTLGLVGAGVMLITIPLQSSGYKKMKQALNIYNTTP